MPVASLKKVAPREKMSALKRSRFVALFFWMKSQRSWWNLDSRKIWNCFGSMYVGVPFIR